MMKKLTALVLMMVMSVCLLAGCGSKTVSIDLSDYMNVLFRGADGKGTARADLDYSGFEKAIMAGSKEGEAALSKITKLESTMTLSVSPNKDLRNGDKVTMTVSYDKDAAKNAGVALDGVSREFTVSGLSASGAETTPGASSAAGTEKAAETDPASVELDAFDPAYWNTENGIAITYEEVSPYGFLRVTNNLPAENPLSKVNYQFAEYQDLHEGDEVTVTVSFKDAKMKNQYHFKELTGTYTVGPVDHYLTDASELDSQTIASLQKSALDLALQSTAGTLEFQTAEGYKGFYNGEAVTVDSSEAGNSIYALRHADGFIGRLAIPACLHVTVTEPDWMENHKSYAYDLLFFSTVSGIIVHADGSITADSAELTNKGTAEMEDELISGLGSWFDAVTVEKIVLTGN